MNVFYVVHLFDVNLFNVIGWYILSRSWCLSVWKKKEYFLKIEVIITHDYHLLCIVTFICIASVICVKTHHIQILTETILASLHPAGGIRTAGRNLPTFPSHPLLSLVFLPSPSLPFFSPPSFSLESSPLNAARGYGERRMLPHRGVRRSPSRNRI